MKKSAKVLEGYNVGQWLALFQEIYLCSDPCCFCGKSAPLPLRPLTKHCCEIVAAIQGFPGNKHITPVADRLGFVALIQDNEVVSDVPVHEVRPEVGMSFRSPLAPLELLCNILGSPV